jgi:hypothetical protein
MKTGTTIEWMIVLAPDSIMSAAFFILLFFLQGQIYVFFVKLP